MGRVEGPLRGPRPHRQNYELYAASPALRAWREFPDRTHYTIGQPGWEEVADAVLSWAEAPVAG